MEGLRKPSEWIKGRDQPRNDEAPPDYTAAPDPAPDPAPAPAPAPGPTPGPPPSRRPAYAHAAHRRDAPAAQHHRVPARPAAPRSAPRSPRVRRTRSAHRPRSTRRAGGRCRARVRWTRRCRTHARGPSRRPGPESRARRRRRARSRRPRRCARRRRRRCPRAYAGRHSRAARRARRPAPPDHRDTYRTVDPGDAHLAPLVLGERGPEVHALADDLGGIAPGPGSRGGGLRLGVAGGTDDGVDLALQLLDGGAGLLGGGALPSETALSRRTVRGVRSRCERSAASSRSLARSWTT